MANSGPGWESIDRAWCWLQTERENERLRREREDAGQPLLPRDSPVSALTFPSRALTGTPMLRPPRIAP